MCVPRLVLFLLMTHFHWDFSDHMLIKNFETGLYIKQKCLLWIYFFVITVIIYFLKIRIQHVSSVPWSSEQNICVAMKMPHNSLFVSQVKEFLTKRRSNEILF